MSHHPWRSYLAYFVLAGLWSLWVLWIAGDELDRRPGIDWDQLLLDPHGIPALIPGGTPGGQQWAPGGYDSMFDFPDDLAASGGSAQTWSPGGAESNVPVIAQFATTYFAPAFAILPFLRYSPPLTVQWPGLPASTGPAHLVTPHWTLDTAADQQGVACTSGTADQCHVWYWWGRYGQYIVQLRLFSPAVPVSTSGFATLVSYMDRTIAERLANVTVEYPSPHMPLMAVGNGINFTILALLYSLFAWIPTFGTRFFFPARLRPLFADPTWQPVIRRQVIALTGALLSWGTALWSAPLLRTLAGPGGAKWVLFGLLLLLSAGCMAWAARQEARLAVVLRGRRAR